MTTSAASIAKKLDDASPETRRLAIVELTAEAPESQPKEAAELLFRALGDVDWRVRKEAANAAPRIAARDLLVSMLCRALDDKNDVGLRNAAVEAMIALGPDVLDDVVALLGRLDADGRKLAVEVCAGLPDPRGVAALVGRLDDEDANVRATAAEALGRAGLAGEAERASAVLALTARLESGEVQLTLAALDALARLDARLPWTVFEPLANQPMFRRHAIVAAARSREEAALLALVFATGDASPTVAREAVLALASWLQLEPVSPAVMARARAAIQASARARTHVIALVEDTSDPRVRGAALVALGLLERTEDVPRIVAALDDEEVSEDAVTALETFGASASGPLTELLASSPERTRAVLLSMLPRLDASPDPRVLESLRTGLRDNAADVAVASLKGIAALGEAEDMERLFPLSRHADPRVALTAASALRALARRHPDAARALVARIDPTGDQAMAACALVIDESGLELLERAITHRDARARRLAVDTLALVGGERAKGHVAFALADEEREVRLAAVRALGQLGRADVLANLVETSENDEVVIAALRALGEADRAQGFASARARVESANPAIACAAVESIDRFGAGDAREDALFEALGHPDSEVVKLALTILAQDPDARALARLGMCLDHDSWEVRRLTSELLGQSKSPAAQALLRARLEREREPAVRDALTNALSLRPPPEFGEG